MGNQVQPWTQEQIDEFMESVENEMFDDNIRRGTGDSITSITREDSEGNETTYTKEDGVWSECHS